MITVTAQQDFTFRDVTMARGDVREINTMIAVALKSKGLVAYGQPEVIPAKTPRKKRQYKRRDLTADTVKG